jgi:alginate O-acetyltransferase complex protein AlgI
LLTYRNLMITFVLGGLWHGAAWTFVVWGAIHGFFLSVEHWRRTRRAERGLAEPADTAWRRWGARLLTFQIVCFAWVFFRAESLSNAFDILARIFDPAHWLQASPLVKFSVLLAIAVGIGEQYISKGVLARMMARFSRLSPVSMGIVLGFVLLVINTMGPRGVAPFIYFRF